jgi:type II secretory pathway pseudopilin PulG
VLKRRAFTLLELLIIFTIIAILSILSLPILSKLQSRAQRAQCTANLRSLYAAAELFIQENGSWPQIDITDSDDDSEYAKKWVAALAPFGPTQKTWICPTIQNLLGNPDVSSSSDARIDYVATTFDDKPTSPHQWPKQPWFAEAQDVHGHGNLIIFTDGTVSDLRTATGR